MASALKHYGLGLVLSGLVASSVKPNRAQTSDSAQQVYVFELLWHFCLGFQ